MDGVSNEEVRRRADIERELARRYMSAVWLEGR